MVFHFWVCFAFCYLWEGSTVFWIAFAVMGATKKEDWWKRQGKFHMPYIIQSSFEIFFSSCRPYFQWRSFGAHGFALPSLTSGREVGRLSLPLRAPTTIVLRKSKRSPACVYLYWFWGESEALGEMLKYYKVTAWLWSTNNPIDITALNGQACQTKGSDK